MLTLLAGVLVSVDKKIIYYIVDKTCRTHDVELPLCSSSVTVTELI